MPIAKTRRALDTNASSRHGEIYFHTRTRPMMHRGRLDPRGVYDHVVDWLSDHDEIAVAVAVLVGLAVIVLSFWGLT
jgi:hypothetical protein